MKPNIQQLVDRGALFVINHSGGKDSQAMYLHVSSLVPAEQIVHVHADLGAVEWAGAVDHIRATTRGEPLHVCQAQRKDGSVHGGLLEMIDRRGMFPSPEIRQCTSDLKRGPIERTIRAISKATGRNLIVNCMGMRAEESSSRKKLKTFRLSTKNSVAGREWYEWLPIHDWTEDMVFACINRNGQEPHKVYGLGMRRFSCVFCIMASEEDLKTAARLATEQPELLNDPHLYARYVGLERSTGQVMLMPKKGVRRSLEEVTGIKADLSVLEAA